MPGLSTERMSLYLAPYDERNRVSAGGGATHEEERIEVVELSLAQLASFADSARLADMKTLLLVQTPAAAPPDLFGP